MLVSATLNVADLFPARALFGASAVLAALANLGLLLVGPGEVGLAYALRFATGLFLAGVYPTGLKVMAGWFRQGRGMAMGLMVGALTVGSASPHLVRGLGLDWRGVVATASVLTVAASLLMAWVGDGPHDAMSSRFRWRQVADAMSTRGTRLATFGYLGHMWELYAVWTWIGAYLAASAGEAGSGYPSIPVLTFAIIASGGVGAWIAGRMADRSGRALVAGGSMAISGACSLLSAAVFGAPAWLVVPVMVVWESPWSPTAPVLGDGHRDGHAETAHDPDRPRLPPHHGHDLGVPPPGGRLAVGVRGLAIGPALGVAAMARFRQVMKPTRIPLTPFRNLR